MNDIFMSDVYLLTPVAMYLYRTKGDSSGWRATQRVSADSLESFVDHVSPDIVKVRILSPEQRDAPGGRQFQARQFAGADMTYSRTRGDCLMARTKESFRDADM